MSIQPTGAAPTRTVERNSEPAPLQARPVAVIDSPGDKAVAVPTQAELRTAVENINKSMQAQSQALEFSIDEDSQRTIVKIVDTSTQEVIRQIPTLEALEISKALDTAQGLLIRQTA